MSLKRLFLTPTSVKIRSRLDNYVTILVQHFEYWKEALNGQIELSYMLVCSNNLFVKICMMKIHPRCFGTNDPNREI